MIEFIKNNKEYSFVLFLLFLSIVNNFISIEYFRIFNRDDVWSASYAYNFYKTSVPFDVMAREVGMILAHGTLLDYVYGFFMNLFPNSYLVHRYVSFVIGLYFLFILYKIFYLFIKDRILVLKTVVFISFLEYFVFNSHLARADILGSSLVFTAFYIFIKSSSRWNYISASFLLGIGVDIHFATLIGIFLFLGYELVFKRFEIKKYKIYILSILSFLLGTTVWFFTHYNDMGQVIKAYNFLKSVSLETSFFDRLLFFYNFGIESKYYRHFIFLFILTFSFIIFIFYKKRIDEELKNIFLVFVFGLFGFIIFGRTNPFYLWYFFPLLYLFFIVSIHRFKFGKYLYYLLIFYHILFWSIVYKRDYKADYNNYEQKIREVTKQCVNKNTLIVAPANIWYIFRNNEFLSYNARVDFNKILNRKNVLIIVNDPLNEYLTDGKIIGNNTGIDRFSKTQLLRYTKIGMIMDYDYGSFGLHKNNKILIYYKK